MMNNIGENLLRIAFWTSMYDADAAGITLYRMASFSADETFHFICKPDERFIVFVFCLNGSCRVTYDEKKYNLSKGNAFVVSTLKGYEVDSASDNFQFCYVTLTGTLAKQLYIHQIKDRGHIMPYNSEILALWEQIYSLAKKGWTYESEIRISCLLYSMYGELMIAKNQNTALQPAVSYMQEHYSEDIYMTDLADKCYLGSSQFIKKFKECYGVTPVNYLTALRIDKAKYYLIKTEKPVSEIASLVGFDDASYFTRVFKRSEGMTPKEYRNSVF